MGSAGILPAGFGILPAAILQYGLMLISLTLC